MLTCTAIAFASREVLGFRGITAMYTIQSDPAQQLITVTMSGFLTVEEVQAFSDEEQGMVAALGWGSGEYLLLIRTEDATIQSQEVVAKFTDIVANSIYKAKRIAVVRGTSLTRLQTHRILSTRDNAAIFADGDEAEAWLFDDSPADSSLALGLATVPRRSVA
jgi:hypothetical protein